MLSVCYGLCPSWTSICLAYIGGFVEGKAVSAQDVVALAKLPSKDVLRAMLLGTLQAPCTQLVGVMNQKVASLVYVLSAVKDKKEQEA